MKEFFWKKRITAIIFISLLYVFAIFNIVKNRKVLVEAIKFNTNQTMNHYVANLDKTVNENIIGKYAFIETFGEFNVLLDKKEENNFEQVMDKEGVLYNTYFATEVSKEISEVADTVEKLEMISKSAGSEFYVVSPPDKFLPGVSTMEEGYPYNYSNETIDCYLEKLRKKNIDYIDLRKPLIESNWNLQDIFYKTDHHWTTQASFLVFQSIVHDMESKYDVSLDPKGYFTDKENYNFVNYEKALLGSQGRKTGVVYSGMDDFTLIYPKFKTKFKFTIDAMNYEATGKMEDTLINQELLNENISIYERDLYDMYTHGTMYPFGKIQNKRNKKGPKVLVIRDSFSCAPITFFSSLCKEVDLVYPYTYKDDIKELITEGDYDYVMLFSYPGNLTKAFYTFNFGDEDICLR